MSTEDVRILKQPGHPAYLVNLCPYDVVIFNERDRTQYVWPGITQAAYCEYPPQKDLGTLVPSIGIPLVAPRTAVAVCGIPEGLPEGTGLIVSPDVAEFIVSHNANKWKYRIFSPNISKNAPQREIKWTTSLVCWT